MTTPLTAGWRTTTDGVKIIMIKKLSVFILAVMLLAGCSPFESYPQQHTTTTTTTSCPDGTQLQSDGMCR
jgi:PBP1b-binding outer membrane lipoprotein LpoB